MGDIVKIWVHCGARNSNQEFSKQARCLGKIFNRYNAEVYFGGSAVGLGFDLLSGMSDETVVKHVMPLIFRDQINPNAKTEDIIWVEDINQRKQFMLDCDCMVALPGGYGTFDEIFSVFVNTICYRQKNLYVLNILEYFNPLKELLAHIDRNGFSSNVHSDIVTFVNDLDELDKFLALEFKSKHK